MFRHLYYFFSGIFHAQPVVWKFCVKRACKRPLFTWFLRILHMCAHCTWSEAAVESGFQWRSKFVLFRAKSKQMNFLEVNFFFFGGSAAARVAAMTANMESRDITSTNRRLGVHRCTRGHVTEVRRRETFYVLFLRFIGQKQQTKSKFKQTVSQNLTEKTFFFLTKKDSQEAFEQV